MNALPNLDGVFDPNLRLGVVSSVTANDVRVNLHEAGAVGGSLFRGARYGLGEVGEFVLIEGELVALLGRIIEVKLPERERLVVDKDSGGGVTIDAYALVQLLGTVSLEDLTVTSGVSTYPRLGDRVYSAPDSFLSSIPMRMERGDKAPEVALRIGRVSSAASADILITPERLFGRHCAVLGATGGGKSYTVSRLIEECLHHSSKVILIDATGEYRDFSEHTTHIYLGTPNSEPENSTKCSLPPSSFTEGDFLALFEPAGKTQVQNFGQRSAASDCCLCDQHLNAPENPDYSFAPTAESRKSLKSKATLLFHDFWIIHPPLSIHTAWSGKSSRSVFMKQVARSENQTQTIGVDMTAAL